MITKNGNMDFAPLAEYLKRVPYELIHTTLYDAATLYEGFVPGQPEAEQDYYDRRVYQHYRTTGKFPNSIEEATARILHDHSMRVAVSKFVKAHDYMKFVGVMGGHGLQRTEAMYRQIVFLSKRLTEQGFMMLSGGGPGAMEATHLGAWLAGRGDDEVEEALQMLTPAPTFGDEGWLAMAIKVMERFPQTTYESLSIPTWTYGHEPPTPFATHIAKLFDNSIREDLILTLSFGGVIFTPGSAGTMQEVFQNAVQNHYLSFGFASPMIFFGQTFWTNDIPVFPLLQGLMAVGKYKNLSLTLTDDTETVMRQLLDFQEKVRTNPEAFKVID